MTQRRYGTILSCLSICFTTVIGLIFTPFLVKSLGPAEYGLYTLVGSLIANLAILDVGLSESVVRFVAKYRALKQRDREDTFLGVATLIYVGIAVLVVIVGLVVSANLPAIFHKGLTLQEIYSARFMLLILVGSLALSMSFNAVSATLVAYESFIFLRLLEMTAAVLSTATMAFALVSGRKVVAIAAILAIANCMALLAKVFYAFFVLKVRLKFERPTWHFIKEVGHYSSAIFVVIVAEQIYWKLDGVILGAMMGTSVVAVYMIGMSFSKYLTNLSAALSRLLMPKVVRRVEQGADAVELTDLLISVSRIQSIVILPILLGMVMFGREFVYLWIGPEFRAAYTVMLATLLPYSLELLGGIRNQIMQAKQVYWYRSITILALSVANIALTIVLVNLMGMVGAAISTGLGVFIGYVVLNYVLKVKIGINVSRYFRELFSGLLPAAILSGLAAFLMNLLLGGSWPALGAKLLAFVAIFSFSVWFIGITPEEKQMIRELLPGNRPDARKSEGF
jgi:O-antigen/teichoic acid export membrane protein